jgi:hypothetical protein
MTDAFAPALQRQLDRLGAHLDADIQPGVSRTLAAIVRIRFPDRLVLSEPWLVSYPGLLFEPFGPAASSPFHLKHAVYGIARSDETALWAKVDGPADDPLVCVRDDAEDEDDFEAIEAEGRLFRPLSEVLGFCHPMTPA